jgi:thioredoxin-like negative regulator of GroEL
MVIVTEIDGIPTFTNMLQNSPGRVIVKFGATWCGPCKQIAQQVQGLMHQITEVYSGKVICCDIDIDESFEVYAFLKSKKMVNGIPAILTWDAGNVTFIPSDSAIGSNVNEINLLFSRCTNKLSLLK